MTENEALTLQGIIEWIGVGVEVAGVAVIVIGITIAVARYLQGAIARAPESMPYTRLRVEMGRALLLGLEFLVAADIIRTVATAPSFENLAVLGLLVIIRTFLSWTLELEIEGRWPWQTEKQDFRGLATWTMMPLSSEPTASVSRSLISR